MSRKRIGNYATTAVNAQSSSRSTMQQVKSSASDPPGPEAAKFRCIPGGIKHAAFDDDYVRRLIAGDPPIERHFFEYFSELLWIKLRSRLRNAALIDDVRQETLLRVLTALKERHA